MNSLEFIKQHVTEWSSDECDRISLSNDGFVCFGYELKSGYQSIDLSEHFAPDYYDGKVWTREEFEACGKPTVDWDEAPEWATSYGILDSNNLPIWYSDNNYSYVNNPYEAHRFCGDEKVRLVELGPDVVKPKGIDSRDNLNDGKKYETTIIGLCGTAVKIDIYRVLDAYPQVDPHIEHLIKKALKPGERGHKDKRTDYLNIIESAQKALILLDQKERLNDAK